MEPQARVPDLPRVGAKPAHQAAQTPGPREALGGGFLEVPIQVVF